MRRIILTTVISIILTTASAHAMSAGERLYMKKTRQAAPVTRYTQSTVAVETVTERPSSANYKAGHKYFGSLQLMQRDRMVKRRQDQLAKAEGGQDRITYCENKYWDSLRYAACVGEPTR